MKVVMLEKKQKITLENYLENYLSMQYGWDVSSNWY